ncbi:MAG TPA: TlpA disulfide reductase family protein [Geobacteraceae bacterium]
MKRAGIIAIAFLLLATGNALARAPRVGEPVSPFRLADLGGKTVDTGQLRGKTVVIYFWNDKCGCSEQLVQLRDFVVGRRKQPFVFLTVNEGQGRGVAEGFVREHNLPYQVLLDNDLAVGTKLFGIKVLPTIFVIDKGGVLREKMIGIVKSKRLETIIARYL